MSEANKRINIGDTTSVQGLKEDLETIALAYVTNTPTLVALIYTFAVNNRRLFEERLKKPRAAPGGHIGTIVSEEVAKELENWAKNSQPKRSRGLLCCYILQKALEDDIIDGIMSTKPNGGSN